MLFIKIHLPPTFILRYVRAKIIVYAFMIELDQPDYRYPRKGKKYICTKSTESYFVADSSRVPSREGDIHNFA